MNLSTDALLTLARLRPPFARSALLLFPHTNEGRVNPGITVEMLVGEPVIAAGTGSVRKVYNEIPLWQTTDATLRTTAIQHVLIDHGNRIFTLLGGLSSVEVTPGQTVQRGDRIGSLLGNQLFFAAYLAHKSLNPLTLNQHWVPQNANVVTGQGGRIRFAPDRIVRDLSEGFLAVISSGIRYFKRLLAPAPLLVNVAFNGDGSKAGLAATGYSDSDYWNVYTPVDFLAVASSACYYYYGGNPFYTFSDAPVLCLNDYLEQPCSIMLQRVAPQFSAAGAGVSWDNMLKAWIGGYLGMVPYENTFILRNMPAGNYHLYLYANQGALPDASAFYVSVGAGAPAVQTNSPTLTPAFVEGANYVRFTLGVPAGSYITFKAVGYLSGMQLERF